MSDSIQIECPTCKQRMQLKRPDRPVQVSCPKCQQVMQLGAPAVTQAPVPDATAPATSKAPSRPTRKVENRSPARTPVAAKANHLREVRGSKRRANASTGSSKKAILITATVAGLIGLLGVGGGVIWWLLRDSTETDLAAERPGSAREAFETAQGRLLEQRSPRGQVMVPRGAQAMQQKTDAIIANAKAEIAKANAEMKSTAAAGGSSPQPKAPDLPTALSIDGHRASMTRLLRIGSQMEETVDSVKDNASRQAARQRLENLTEDIEELVSESLTLERLTSQQLTALMSEQKEALMRHSDAMEKAFNAANSAGHMSSKSFRIAFFRATSAMKSSVYQFEMLWTLPKSPWSSQEKAEFQLLEIYRQLCSSVLAVGNPNEYRELNRKLNEKTKELDDFEQQKKTLLTKDAFLPDSSYHQLLTTYRDRTEQRLDRLNQEYEETSVVEARKLYRQAWNSAVIGFSNRMEAESLQERFAGSEGEQVNAKVAVAMKNFRLRQQVNPMVKGKQIAAIHFTWNAGALTSKVHQALMVKGDMPYLTVVDGGTLGIVVFDGPISEIADMASTWGKVVSVDRNDRVVTVDQP